MKELQFTVDWFTEEMPTFQRHLAQLAGKPFISFLEIGTFEGRCACWLLQNVLTHPTARLTCIDPFDWKTSWEYRAAAGGYISPMPQEIDIEGRFDANITALGVHSQVRKLKGTSRRILPSLISEQFDGIYIDGSHLAADVLTDAVLSWELLKMGGILFFDDYGLGMFANPLHNPAAGIDAFLTVFGEHCHILQKDYLLVLEKRPCAHEPALRHLSYVWGT